MTIEFSEEIFNEALEKISWAKLSKHLGQMAWTPKDVKKLVGLLSRSEPLVLKRDNVQDEERRDKLLSSAAQALEDKGFAEEAKSVQALHDKLREISSGYKGILETLAKCDAASMSSELRVAALLDRASREFKGLMETAPDAISRDGEVDLNATTLTDENGHEYSPEAMHEMLVFACASTMGMEAHRNKWYDPDGILVLPALPDVTEADRFAVGSVVMLATAWRHWQHAERRHRYLGAVLAEHTKVPESLAGMSISRIWESRPKDGDEFELYCHLANARLRERLMQHWLTVSTDKKYIAWVSGIENPLPLLPKATVSLSEIHGATALSQLLSGEITADKTEYAGLLLAEWVRGYSVLQAVSQAALEEGAPEGMLIRYTKSKLASKLERLGLREGKGAVFIGHMLYRKASRDLFDQPLIQLRDGEVLLLALAASQSSIPIVILSTLGMLQVNLDSRGKRFEERTIEFLRGKGIAAKNILCNRGGETYDYDVAFVLGDYLFLVECKSRGLPGSDPVRMHYFSLGIRDVVKQVKRLAEGLKRYPDIIPANFPEAVGKKVVHCVMNALPFAMFGGVDGIYFTDEASFSRTFLQAEIGQRRVSMDGGMGEIEPDAVIAILREGKTPTSDELGLQLVNPIQLVLENAFTQTSWLTVPLREDALLRLFEFSRTSKTTEELRLAAKDAGHSVPKAAT